MLCFFFRENFHLPVLHSLLLSSGCVLCAVEQSIYMRDAHVAIHSFKFLDFSHLAEKSSLLLLLASNKLHTRNEISRRCFVFFFVLFSLHNNSSDSAASPKSLLTSRKCYFGLFNDVRERRRARCEEYMYIFAAKHSIEMKMKKRVETKFL